MQTTAKGQKQTKQPSSSIKNRQSKKVNVAKKPAVRTTELNKMVQIVLTSPDSVTHAEFTQFQSAVGYRQAAKLMNEGNNRKKREQNEEFDKDKKVKQSDKNIKNQLSEKPADNKTTESIKNKKEEIKSSKAVSEKGPNVLNTQTKNTEVKQKAPAVPVAEPKKENKPAKNTEENEQKKEKEQVESATKEGEANNDKPLKKDTEQKSDKNNGEAKQDKNVKDTEKKETPQKLNIGEIAGIGSDKKESKKAPKVKINNGEPEDILGQLANVPPTQALAGYSEAAEVSKASLAKQKDKTQDKVPKIPAPTGLSPIKNNNTGKRETVSMKHPEIGSFRSERAGGEAQKVHGEMHVGGDSEPEEIMGQVSEFSKSAPDISLNGEADPSQMEGFKAETSQNVENAKQEELGQVDNDFGENDIYPIEDNTVLKSNRKLKAAMPKVHKVKSTLQIPGEMEGKLNKTLGPELRSQINEQKNAYKKGKNKFDTNVSAAKENSEIQREQLKSEAETKQLNEQERAQAEVGRLRGQWKEEIHGAVAEYDHQAGAETQAKTHEISNVKAQKDKEIKERMATAEQDAKREYKTTKKKAEDKKKEKENEKKQDKAWYEKAVDWVKDKASKFVEGLKKAINFIYDGFRKIVKGIFALAKAAVTGIIEVGRRMITGIIKNFGRFLKGLVKIVFAKFPKISKKLCGMIDKAVNKAVKFVNAAADFLKKGVSAVLDFLAETLDKLLGVVQALYNGALSFIGMLISGKFKEIMAGIASLGKAAKASLSHIEGAVWEQLVGVDLSKPMGEDASVQTGKAETGSGSGKNEKLLDGDIEVDHVENEKIDEEFLQNIALKDGQEKYINGSNNPSTTESIMNEFDLDKATEKSGGSFADGVKLRAKNGAKILDQMKQYVIKWLKANWGKLLLGVLGALAGIVAAEILTGGAITAALPTIITVVTNLMNAAAVVSIVDTIAKAAGNIETFLTQGWIGNITVAAVALATAIAMGLVELAMDLGFKAVGAGLKSAGKAVKKGFKAAAKGTKSLIKSAGKGMRSLIKSGAKLVSKTGSMVIQNGKLIIKSLSKGYSKGVKKLGGLLDKVLAKFRFKRFKLERKGKHIRIYGEVNPWVLLYDGTVEWKEHDELGIKGKTKLGQKVTAGGKEGIVVGVRKTPSKAVSELLDNTKDAAKTGKNIDLYKALDEGKDDAKKLIDKSAAKAEVHNEVNYVKLSNKLGKKIENEGYKVISVDTAEKANAGWANLGFDKPPVAANTTVYSVEAGKFRYSRVYLEGSNKPVSRFILRAEDVEGLSAKEIAQKYALPKVPNKICDVELPSNIPLEVSITGPQVEWGTIGGDVQYALKNIDLNRNWFTNMRDLK